jgi:hypothetical protein
MRHYLSFDLNFVKHFGIIKRRGEIVIQSSVLFFCKRSPERLRTLDAYSPPLEHSTFIFHTNPVWHKCNLFI